MARLLAEQPGIRDRLFTDREQAYCEPRVRRAQNYAARFAAKEAVLKALGTGLGRGMRWTDVEVVRHLDGRPEVHLHGAVADLAAEQGLQAIDASLTHTADHAIATAVAVFTGG